VILFSEKASLSGSVDIPGSKSHTIRALAIATLAGGTSRIVAPLDSADTRACLGVCRALGAEITEEKEAWTVAGTAGKPKPAENVIDVANSGTTLFVALGMAALGEGWNVFTGDAQTRRRSAQPLLHSLEALGAQAVSTRGNGCAPIIVRGPLVGGRTLIACPTSQYLTSLLIAAPLAAEDVHIVATELNEKPYVEMTLSWLDRQSITYTQKDVVEVSIPGGQAYRAFTERIKADFSSATFFLCAAAITGSTLTLNGLDMGDSQGDKAVVEMLRGMGAEIETLPGGLRIRGHELKGADIDLNATPDALPAMAVTGCFAEGTTRLLNVPQARIKETDRIAVMRETIESLGGKAEELPDGLVVHGTGLRGGKTRGHGDHRVVMAAAVAGMASDRPVEVDTAEAAAVTFPDFAELMRQCGAKIATRGEAKTGV